MATSLSLVILGSLLFSLPLPIDLVSEVNIGLSFSYLPEMDSQV